MSNPIVSILIPCRNEQDFIEDNVRSCFDQSYEGEIEVLVIDGFSDDNTRSIVNQLEQKFSNLKLVDNPHKTTPQALNIGIRECKGSYFVILGGHAKLHKDFIKKNVENFTENSIACTGGIIENVYLNNTGKAIGKAMSSVFGVGNATFRTGGTKSKVDTVAFGMYKKSIVDEIGYFDEKLVRNQDDEFNFRVTRKHDIVFDPEIKSLYYVRGNFLKLFKQYFQYGYWKVYVNKIHKTITSWRQLIPAILVLGLVIGINFSLFGSNGLFNAGFFLLFFFGLNMYIGAAMIFAGKKSSSFIEWAMIVLSFFILHASYGLGYWKGIVHFLILRRTPTVKSKELSR